MRRSCPICGTENFSESASEYSQRPWLLKECSRCSMLYLENPPEYKALEETFAWERTYTSETEHRRKRNPFLYRLGRMPKALVQKLFKRDKLLHLVKSYCAPGKVLDVGCASGHTLAGLPPQYIPYGVEISQELSREAEARFVPRGGQVIQADALRGLQQVQGGGFSGIIMTSFLEHEANVQAVLQATRGAMRSGAKLIVKVPNFASWNRLLRGPRWCGFRSPDHVNYFTPGLLKRLLEEAGFRVVQFNLADRMPTSDTMWMVAEVA